MTEILKVLRGQLFLGHPLYRMSVGNMTAVRQMSYFSSLLGEYHDPELEMLLMFFVAGVSVP